MKPDEMQMLFEYAWWARDRLLEAARDMTDEEFSRENGFTYGSLRGILVHAMDAEESWCSRFLSEQVAPEPSVDEFISVEALKQRWSLTEQRWRGYLAGLAEVALGEDFVLRRRNGEEHRTPLWVVLTHVVNHGTQHRSEAAEALTMARRSPGSLDLTTFAWTRRP